MGEQEISSARLSAASSPECERAEALLVGQWNHLPKEFGDDGSVYRAFARWEKEALSDILWTILLTRRDVREAGDVPHIAP